MKPYLPMIVFVCLVIMMVFQGVLFTSTGLQAGRLQKQIADISQKVDSLQTTTNYVQESLTKIKNETSVTDIQSITNAASLTAAEDSNNVLSAANLSQTLGTETTANNILRLKIDWKSMDVFEAAHSGSRVVGQITSGLDYAIIGKQADWYQINLDTLTNAWVQAKFVYETN